MRTKEILLLCTAALLLAGCAIAKKDVIIQTGTIIGVDISENPVTQLYHAKLGYARAELAFVPANTNGITPDVITEIHYGNIFSPNGGIYQRMAVGSNAVAQPGAAALFSKDQNGNVNTNWLGMLKAVSPVPVP